MAELDSDWTDHGSPEDHADQLDLLSMQAVDSGNYGRAAILHVAADCIRGLSAKAEVLEKENEALREALQQAVTSMQDSGYSNKHVAVLAARQALAAHDRGEK